MEELNPITSKNTYVAPVNAEETEYLVIEDDFPNGRSFRILIKRRADVYGSRNERQSEKMKVCTCLNLFIPVLQFLMPAWI